MNAERIYMDVGKDIPQEPPAPRDWSGGQELPYGYLFACRQMRRKYWLAANRKNRPTTRKKK